MGFDAGFFVDFGGDGGFLFGGEPRGVDDAIVEEEEDDDAEDDGGDGFEDEEPLPSGDAVGAGEVAHDVAGERAADDAGDGAAGEQDGDDVGAAVGGEPVGEVEDHAGEEAGFGDAEQAGAWCRTRPGRADERGAAGDDAPGDEDAADPDARADLVQDEVAGDFEEEVAEEEDAGAEAVDALRELEVAEHLQLGEADVDAIDVGDDVGERAGWA